MVDALFLLAYAALPVLTWWRSRSVTWTVIALTASVSLFGGVLGFVIDHVMPWNRLGLQLLLLVALLVPAVLAFLRPAPQDAPRRLQVIAILGPVLVLAVYFAVVTTWWTEVPAYLNPVSYLIGHSMAEDNAKWLDFTSAFAAGGPIEQRVPMGGPLQLVLVFVATFMGVASQATLGGYNQVMVAANTVVFGEYLMVVIAPLALAPLVGARLRRPTVPPGGLTRVPWPLIWAGVLIVVVTNLMLTAYGHLTLQFTLLVCVLWVTAFATWTRQPRALLLTSLAVAMSMTVWLPMNAIAGLLVVAWLAHLIVRGVREGRTGWDPIALGAVVLVAVCIAEPMRSSLSFILGSTPTATGDATSVVGGSVRMASAPVPGVVPFLGGLTDSTLFEAGGGTEKATALLALLAAAAVIGAAIVISRQGAGRTAYLRLAPVAVLVGFALLLTGLDQWATGSAPHYGALKFTFMATVVVIAGCLPIALMLLDPAKARMTLPRWAAVGAVAYLLVIDSLLVRSIAAARPEQWSPPIPFNNPRSYWWPAEVNRGDSQPIDSNPIACVYLPQGAVVPSAILASQLSDAQRVYSCTRLLAALGGQDFAAQPVVDWLRREWTNNESQWEGVYGYLAGMPREVLERKVILLDDGSNVIGLESLGSLLSRYPADAVKRAAEGSGG